MLERAVAALSADLLQFGSDRFLPCPAASIREAIAEMQRLLDTLDLPVGARERVMAGTADAWLRPLPGGQ